MHLEVSAMTTTIGSAWELLCYSHIFGSPLFLRLASPALSVPMKRTIEYGTYTPLTLGNSIKQYRMLRDHRNTTARKFKMSGTDNSKHRHLQLKMSAPTLFSPLATQLNSMQRINRSQNHNHEKIQNVGTYNSTCRHLQLKMAAPTLFSPLTTVKQYAV
jgi:hypothetical protein